MPADTMSRTRWKAKLQAASALTKVTLLLFSPHKYWIVDGKTLTFKATGGNKVNRCQYFRPNVQRLKAIRKSIEFEDSIKLTFITGQVRNAASKKRTDFPLWGFYIATANVCSWCNYSIGHGWDFAMKALTLFFQTSISKWMVSFGWRIKWIESQSAKSIERKNDTSFLLFRSTCVNGKMFAIAYNTNDRFNAHNVFAAPLTFWNSLWKISLCRGKIALELVFSTHFE